MSKDLKYFQEPNGTSERPRGKAACKNMGWGNQIKTVPKQIGQIWGDICTYEAKCESFIVLYICIWNTPKTQNGKSEENTHTLLKHSVWGGQLGKFHILHIYLSFLHLMPFSDGSAISAWILAFLVSFFLIARWLVILLHLGRFTSCTTWPNKRPVFQLFIMHPFKPHPVLKQW